MEMSKKNYFNLLSIILAILVIALSANAYTNTVNLSSTPSSHQIKNPYFVVNSYKYKEYPVNPGDWFDLWVTIQNVGQQDASNVSVTMAGNYPFQNSIGLTKNIGKIYGVQNATISRNNNQETSVVDNQAILRYRVKVDPTASESTYDIKLRIFNGVDNSYQTYYLPIVINKTKTSFDFSLDKSTPWKTTFEISNIGLKDAKGVVVKLLDNGVKVDGANSVSVGNMNAGDFSRVSFDMTPLNSTSNVKLQISYTDLAGIRNVINETVKINPNDYKVVSSGSSSVTNVSNIEWVYVIAGLAMGFVIAFALSFSKRKSVVNEDTKNESSKSKK